MNSKHRRLWLATVGVVVAAAVVFAVVATLARHRLEDAAAAADDHRAADVVAGIVDSSLEELRERESGRPFDQYNAVYRPEGVVAASDALAPSPLSRRSRRRTRAWLVAAQSRWHDHIPFATTRPAVAATLQARVAAPAFNALRAQTKEPRAPLVAAVSAPASSSSSSARARPSAAGHAAAIEAAPAKAPPAIAIADASDVVDNSNTYGKQGVVQQLNSASSGLYSQLQQAEATPSARAAIASQSKLPNVVRNDVVVDEKLEKTSKRKPTKKPMSPSKFKDIDTFNDTPPATRPKPTTAATTAATDDEDNDDEDADRRLHADGL